MTAEQLLNTGSSLALGGHSFSSASWLSYFQANKSAEAGITAADKINVAEAVRTPLIRSLQRFQIGQSGDGKHLKKYAATLLDPAYERCVDLFVKEEQGHARILAQTINAMDGALLTWHWSNLIFIAVRRALGLKTELSILLIAEIIGKCFYKCCADRLVNRALRDTFSLIVLDEIFHLEFHCSFMARQMQHSPQFLRTLFYYCWTAFFYAACLVFIADHWRALQALNVMPQAFLKDCSSTFQRIASKVLL
jgi:hypothetical protein